MIVAALASALHVLSIVLAFMSVHLRASALKTGEWPRAFRMDALWGLSAILLLGTGLWRAFGGLEKGSDYYLHNAAFHTKLTLFVLVVLIEVYPMILLIRCRRNEALRTPANARKVMIFSHVESLLLVLLVLAATLMAHGIGYFS